MKKFQKTLERKTNNNENLTPECYRNVRWNPLVQDWVPLEKYDEIIYIGLSSKFSGTFNNARLAKMELDTDKVHIVDSMNLSSGIGLLLLRACKYRDMGKSALEIVKEVERCVPLVRTQFAINTLDFLHWGGRCSGTAHLFGGILRIKPIVRVVDGGMICD